MRATIILSAIASTIGGSAIAATPTAGPAAFYVGSGAGALDAQVNAYSDNKALIGASSPYAGFKGGVRVATGDVNGDGRADLIVGAGPTSAPGAGTGPRVKVFDGTTGTALYDFFAYEAAFAGGVYVGAGDLNADGKADIVTGAGAGGGPHVKVFSGADGSAPRSRPTLTVPDSE